MIFIYSYLDDSQHQEQLGLGFKVAWEIKVAE